MNFWIRTVFIWVTVIVLFAREDFIAAFKELRATGKLVANRKKVRDVFFCLASLLLFEVVFDFIWP